MSKDLAKKEEKSTAVVAATDLTDMFSENVGQGFEGMGAADVAMPFLMLMQAMSTHLRGATKIPGAEEGDFVNSVTKEVFKKTVNLIPCAFKKAWVEWKPTGTGATGLFVAEHATDEILQKTAKNEKGKNVLPNGNTIEPTCYHYCLNVKEGGKAERVILALKGTQIKKSKNWNSQMGALQLPGKDGKLFIPPTNSHIYTAKSADESREANVWKGWEFGNPQIITNPNLYAVAKEFSNLCTKGLIATIPPVDDVDGPTEPVRPDVM